MLLFSSSIGQDGLQSCVTRIEQQARGALTNSTYSEATAPIRTTVNIPINIPAPVPPPISAPEPAPAPTAAPAPAPTQGPLRAQAENPQASSGYVSHTYINNQTPVSPPPIIRSTDPPMSAFTGQQSNSPSIYQRLNEAAHRQSSIRSSPTLSRGQSRDDQGDHYATREKILPSDLSASNRSSRVYERSSYVPRTSLPRVGSQYDEQSGSNYDAFENK